jgi:hypothetical protein
MHHSQSDFTPPFEVKGIVAIELQSPAFELAASAPRRIVMSGMLEPGIWNPSALNYSKSVLLLSHQQNCVISINF